MFARHEKRSEPHAVRVVASQNHADGDFFEREKSSDRAPLTKRAKKSGRGSRPRDRRGTSLMGRPRTTGCTARHWPDDPCRACAAARAKRSRRRRAVALKEQRAVELAALREQREPGDLDLPDSPDLDPIVAADRHRRRGAAARGYVLAYRRRGLIVPPAACERCGIGERLTHWSRPVPLLPWHPNPRKLREVAWLCIPCRKHVRATREPIVLTWVWPGGVPQRPRGRPVPAPTFEIDPAWRVAAEAAAARARLAGLAAELFLHAFLDAAGPQVEALYAVGVRAGATWAPLGDPVRDAALRGWVERERRRRAAGELLVEPVPAWERRPRRDHLAPVPPPEAERPQLIEPEPWCEPVMPTFAVADAADQEADAFNERVKRLFESWRFRKVDP